MERSGCSQAPALAVLQTPQCCRPYRVTRGETARLSLPLGPVAGRIEAGPRLQDNR